MAKKSEEIYIKTPKDTIVEVYRFKINGKEIRKKRMTFEEFVNMEKLKGYIYKSYQVNFCTIKEVKDE